MNSYSRQVLSVAKGLLDYHRNCDVSPESRRAVLDLHCATNARFTDRLASLFSVIYPARRPSTLRGALGSFTADEQRKIAVQIDRDGFYVFETKIPAHICDEIEKFCLTTPCQIEGSDKRAIFYPREIVSKTYRVSEADIIRCRAVQGLMADPVFHGLAETYLRFASTLSGVNAWWLAPYGDKPGGDAAEEFHFDFDPPPRWLLFFTYLTSVGPDNGPHVFVRGSHKAGLPQAEALVRRGYVRIPDQDIEQAFRRENVVEILGQRGTVMAVDTRGFHKGKMPTRGHRLMLQLSYSGAPFSGAHSRQQTLPRAIHPDLISAMRVRPKVFRKFKWER
jgi:hypothetical protein